MTVEFYQTRAGRRFYEATLPDLVRELKRLADAAERIATSLEKNDGTATKPTPAPAPSPSPKP